MSILNKFELNVKIALFAGFKRGIGIAMAVELAETDADIIGVSASMKQSRIDVEKAVNDR